MATIKDVAATAGVSVTTVSRVLNKRGYISKKVYEKVYRAMEELDYQPNELARNLYRQKTNTIGVLIPDISHPFFSEVVKIIELYLYEKGYKVLLCNAVGDGIREQEYLTMLRQSKVDGILIGTHMLETSSYESINLPVVALDILLGEKIPTVCADHARGGQLAAQEFIRCGCRCVLNVSGNLDVMTPSLIRHTTFEKELRAHGAACINACLRQEFNRETYFSEVFDIFQQHPDADGFFSTDLVALNAMKVIRKLGKRIPDDVVVVGYDGVECAKLCNPELTHVKQPLEEIARTCVDILLQKIAGEAVSENVFLKNVVLVRGGTSF